MNDESFAGPFMQMEAAAFSKVGEAPVRAVAWSARQPKKSAKLTLAPIKIQDSPDPSLIDTPVTLAWSKAPGPKPYGIDQAGFPMQEPARMRVWEIGAPNRDEAIVPIAPRDGGGHSVGLLTGALLGALGLWWVGGSDLYRIFEFDRRELADKAAINAVVEWIIHAESNGDRNLKNKRSSATGTGQFLDGTWLEMIRAHRADLVEGRSEKDILELRRDPQLARQITTRFVEQSAAILNKRGLPVTPCTLYLAYFAGAAGAVAILSFPENADAAALMASADATGRTTREKIVSANPFLGRFTVADLKSWAERKMHAPGFPPVDPANANLAMSSGARFEHHRPLTTATTSHRREATAQRIKRPKRPELPKVV